MKNERSPVQATWNGTIVAESADTVSVEGNSYFPLATVRPGILTASRTRTLCPWKGIASYYDITIGGNVNHDAAWTYRHPSPFARKIKGRVAFWHGVEVGPSSGGAPPSPTARQGKRA